MLKLGMHTCLSDPDNVMTSEDRRDGELLDRSGNIVSAKLDVLQHSGMNATLLEGLDRIDLGRSLLLDLDTFDSGK